MPLREATRLGGHATQVPICETLAQSTLWKQPSHVKMLLSVESHDIGESQQMKTVDWCKSDKLLYVAGQGYDT
jgi:hypothetical protein